MPQRGEINAKVKESYVTEKDLIALLNAVIKEQNIRITGLSKFTGYGTKMLYAILKGKRRLPVDVFFKILANLDYKLLLVHKNRILGETLPL